MNVQSSAFWRPAPLTQPPKKKRCIKYAMRLLPGVFLVAGCVFIVVYCVDVCAYCLKCGSGNHHGQVSPQYLGELWAGGSFYIGGAVPGRHRAADLALGGDFTRSLGTVPLTSLCSAARLVSPGGDFGTRTERAADEDHRHCALGLLSDQRARHGGHRRTPESDAAAE